MSSLPPSSTDETLFSRALECSGTARAAFLDEACAGNLEQRARIELLLRAHAAARTFMVTGSAPPSLPPPATGGAGPRLSYFGDYELIGESARGGMGVVYRARQVSLNRTVAVKMILSGQLASEAEVKRFQVEAEAAANLQHPNIVSIHEIGQHEGRHYFSMDFIEGENLSTYAKHHPYSSREAATLIRTLAAAVHFAHQRGTLHRDLKPQNVLMDANGAPHITDFGLAKRWQPAGPENAEQAISPSELTGTGAIMGSPSYMAPEQASARKGELGPATDVYALGAILYFLLTGRPPFQAASPLDTIQQVIAADPAPPRTLQAEIPAELETICLKCLEKRPERRYASARALAEELDRFLEGEPILARPPGALRRAWSWSARNPWAFAAAASVLLVLALGTMFGLWQKFRFERHQALVARARQMVHLLPAEPNRRERNYREGMQALRGAAEIRDDFALTPIALDLLSRSGRAYRRIEHTRGTHPEAVRATAVSADGSHVAVAFKDGAVEVFAVETGRRAFHLEHSDLRTPLIGLSRDGAWLAVADADATPGELRLWRWADGAAPHVVAAHEGGVTALAFSPTSNRLISAGRTGTALGAPPELRVWNLGETTPAHIITCFQHDRVFIERIRATQRDRRTAVNKINLLVVSPDGTRLFARSDLHQAELLRIDRLNGDVIDGTTLRPPPAVRLPRFSLSFAPETNAVLGTMLNLGVVRIESVDLMSGAETILTQTPWPRREPFHRSTGLRSSNGRFVIHGAMAFDLHAANAPVHLPGRILGAGPNDSWLTVEPALASLLFWRVSDVAEEWQRFGLRETLLDPFQPTSFLPLLLPAGILLGFGLAFALPLFVSLNLFKLSANGPAGRRLRQTVQDLGLGAFCVVVGLAAMGWFIREQVWSSDPMDRIELRSPLVDITSVTATLLANASFLFIAMGVAALARGIRSYHSSLVGAATGEGRSSRVLWAAVFLGFLANDLFAFGPFSPASFWSEGLHHPRFIHAWVILTAFGLAAGYVFMRLLASRKTRQSPHRALWLSVGLAGVVFAPNMLARAFSFGGWFYGFQITIFFAVMLGILLAIVVSPEAHRLVDEDLAKARTQSLQHPLARQAEDILTKFLDAPGPRWLTLTMPAKHEDVTRDRLRRWMLIGIPIGAICGALYVSVIGRFESRAVVFGLILGAMFTIVTNLLSAWAWNRRARRLRTVAIGHTTPAKT